MSSYKRVENRKYNQGEINYVLSRAQAGWDNDTIAKAFKRDHAQYWGDREFNKKQVAYIRSNYKVPWGMVETHTGPMPQFPKSPTSEATPGPSSRAQQKARQVARQPDGTHSKAQNPAVKPANSSRPTTGAQHQQTPAYGGVGAGRSNQGQNFPPRLTNTANDANGPADNLLLQQPANTGSAPVWGFFGLNASSTGLASGDFDFSSFDFPNDDFTSRGSKEPGAGHADFTALLGSQQARDSSKQAHGTTNVNQSHGGTGAQMGNAGTGVSNPMNFGHSTPSASGAGTGVNNSDGFGQGPNVPELPNFIANNPVQSVEREQSATAATPGVQAGTATDASSNTPGHQQPAQAASNARFPPGYTAANAVYRDAHGVWYYDSHDDCHISLGHRHDWDGGVHFSGDVSVTQSFANMHRKEGIGFLLGLAAGQVLHGTGPSQDGLQAATEVARGTLPEERQASVAVPDPAVVQRLMGVNGQLPGNHYYEPFTNRVVQYDMPAGLAFQNGKKGNDTGNRPNQGAGASGGPAQ